MKWTAIVNPAAGGGRAGRLAQGALEQLRTRGLEIDPLYTRHPGEATALARDAFETGSRALLVVGGDGTAYEVVNGVMPHALATGQRPRLGFLPLGTGNSFLRDFTTDGAAGAAEALVRGTTRTCDAVRLLHADGELYFINLLSMGFVADVATTTNQRFKKLGAGGYALSVLVETVGLAPRQWHMRLPDGRHWDPFAVFVSFSNSRFTGGSMEMAPYARTDDGKLDVIVAGPMSRSRLLFAFPKIFRGTHVHMPEIQCAQVGGVELDVHESVDLMIDGEVKRHRPLRLEVVPSAIEVCA